MSIGRETIKAVRMTLVLWILTAIIYPLLILVVGQVAFPYQANGSIIKNLEGKEIGSALIGQTFTSNRYFQARPSTVGYSMGKDAAPTGVSGASNLAPSNPELLKRVQAQVAKLQQARIEPTADLVYASGSGLDPHITLKAASNQLPRIAAARGLSEQDLARLIKRHTKGAFLGIFGEPGVNVVRLNYALDIEELTRKQNR